MIGPHGHAMSQRSAAGRRSTYGKHDCIRKDQSTRSLGFRHLRISARPRNVIEGLQVNASGGSSAIAPRSITFSDLASPNIT